MPIDRRTLLTASAVGATAIAASGVMTTTGAAEETSQSSGKDTRWPLRSGAAQRIVTLEEHFLLLPMADSIKGYDRNWMQPILEDHLADLGDQRLRDMDESGITVQVLSASMPGADLLDGKEGLRFAKAVNDRLAKAVRQHPKRFAGFAHLPMRTPEAAADELERAVSDLGFRGAMINGTTEGRFLDDLRFAPILARAAKLDVPIYIHPNWPPKAVFDAYYAGLPDYYSSLGLSCGIFGWHAEVGIHILRLALAGTFEQHPGLKMIIGHMGEMLPFMLDRIDTCTLGVPCRDEPLSKIILERVYITTSGVLSHSAFQCALTSFGADRILFSVDYPYSSPFQAKDWLDHIAVSPADKLKIIHGNADRLLKLSPEN